MALKVLVNSDVDDLARATEFYCSALGLCVGRRFGAAGVELLGASCAAGASLEGDVHTHVWGRIAVLADPWGHGFCLIQFLGGGYDEIATA